jgi:hypothetical protein
MIICYSDPIHGDGISTVARASIHIYESGWKCFFYPIKQDPGHPTLYPYLLAGLWRFFDKPNLAICHFWNVLFAIGTLVQLKKICKPQNSLATIFLVGISPLFVAQTMMVLTHLALTFFFLGCWQAYRRKKFLHAGFWGSLMVLTHLEGMFLLLALAFVFLTDWIIEKKNFTFHFLKQAFIFFALPILCFGIWLIAHYRHTGWWLSAPEYATHRSLATFGQLSYNFAIIAWRLIDYGYVVFYIGLGWVIWKNRRRLLALIYNDPELRQILTIIATLTILTAVFLSNSIAHRYFLPVQVLIIVYFGEKILNLIHRKGIIITLIIPTIFLGIGNFFYYPFKCIGDANIVYRNYFQLENEIKLRHPQMIWGTYAPLSNPSIHRYLDTQTGLKTYRLYEARFDTCKHILYSNLTCEFTPSQRDSLRLHWKKIDSLAKNGIRVELWERN